MFEHKSEKAQRKADKMTILDTREIPAYSVVRPVVRPGLRPGTTRRRRHSNGPGGAPLRYQGTGVLMSRASHRRRPITPATTVVLALVAAGSTRWARVVRPFGGGARKAGPGSGPLGRGPAAARGGPHQGGH